MIPDPEVSDIPRRDFNLTSPPRVRKLIYRRATHRVKGTHLKFTLQTWNDLEDTESDPRTYIIHALTAPPIIVEACQVASGAECLIDLFFELLFPRFPDFPQTKEWSSGAAHLSLATAFGP